MSGLHEDPAEKYLTYVGIKLAPGLRRDERNLKRYLVQYTRPVPIHF